MADIVAKKADNWQIAGGLFPAIRLALIWARRRNDGILRRRSVRVEHSEATIRRVRRIEQGEKGYKVA